MGPTGLNRRLWVLVILPGVGTWSREGTYGQYGRRNTVTMAITVDAWVPNV